MTTTATTVPFSELLRSTTGRAHSAAQHSPIIGELFSGKLQKERFAELTAQYFAIYSVLEEAGEAMKDDPVAGSFVRSELARKAALEADLAFFLGDNWRDRLSIREATNRYIDRLREVGFTSPGQFIAHHYVRYLGDLSGGQMIGKMVAKSLSLEEEGTSFYRFANIADPDAFKNDYRAKLDALVLSDEERTLIVNEALLAYDLNTAVLAEV